MAGRDFGGEMRLRLADGTNLTLRTAVKINSSGLSTESVTNQNGSVSRVATLKPRKAEVTLQDDNQDMDVLIRAPRQDIYITEEFSGVSHIFSSAILTGEPSSDRANGELSGLAIESEGYERRV